MFQGLFVLRAPEKKAWRLKEAGDARLISRVSRLSAMAVMTNIGKPTTLDFP